MQTIIDTLSVALFVKDGREESELTIRQQAQIIDQIHDSVVSTDLEGYITSWNQGAERLFGYKAQEVLGKHIEIVYQPEKRDFLRHEVIAPLKSEGSHEVEVSMIRKSGESFDAHLTLSLQRDAEEQVIGMIGYSMDITDRKNAENEIIRTKNFLQTLIDYLPVALFVKDAKTAHFGELILINKACEQIFGLKADQALGKTGYDLFPLEQAQFYEQIDREAFDKGKIEDIPAEPIDSHTLGRRILHTVKVPLFDEQNQPQYLLCISEDITERQHAEEALRRS